MKQDKLSEAIKAYDHSLAEHRNQDVVKKREEVCADVPGAVVLPLMHTHTHTHTLTGSKEAKGSGKTCLH